MGNFVVIVITLVVFAVSLIVLNKVFANQKARHTKKSLQDISRGDELDMVAAETFIDEQDKFGESVSKMPVLGSLYIKLKRSGSQFNMATYLIILTVVFVALTAGVTILTKGLFLAGLAVGAMVTLIFNNTYLGLKLEKRNLTFLNEFPDSIDMIVRSVRSGHPLLASLRLISQNSRPPLSTEFQRVIDEVSYGRPLAESLRSMADRIGILDVNFFVVILSVQQETGGSMAEVLSNLSNIIRKRKQLNLKIRALTSEGRITTWIFSGMPFIQIGAVAYLSPNYLSPLIATTTGIYCLVFAICMIGLAIYVSRQLCKMDI